MSRQSPHPVARGLGSPAHKPPRLSNQSPRSSTTSTTPGAVAPVNSHYRNSSHTDSFVRRVQTDLPDDEFGATTISTPSASPVAAASPASTTPGKAARRAAPASTPSSNSSATLTPTNTSTTATTTAASTSSTGLQPADPSTWEDDDAVVQCHTCSSRFTLFLRKHHCRQCGRIFCDNCSRARRKLRNSPSDELVRVCDGCERMLTLDDDTDRPSTNNSNNKQPSQPSQPTKPATPTQSSTASDMMAAMSLAAEAMDGASPATGSGGAVDWTPLVLSLLAEVECGERLRRVQDTMRDEMEAMLQLLAAEVATGAGKQSTEVDVVS